MSRARIHHRYPAACGCKHHHPPGPPARPRLRPRSTSNTLGVGAHLELPPIGTTSTGTLQLRLGRTIPTVLSVPALGYLCVRLRVRAMKGFEGPCRIVRHAVPKIRETAHHGSCYGTAGNQHTDKLAPGQTQCTLWQGSKLNGAVELSWWPPYTFRAGVRQIHRPSHKPPGAPLPATYRHATAFFCNFVLRLLVGDHLCVLVTRSLCLLLHTGSP